MGAGIFVHVTNRYSRVPNKRTGILLENEKNPTFTLRIYLKLYVY